MAVRTHAALIVLLAALAVPAVAQDDQLTASTFVVGDVIVTWKADSGSTIMCRGVPVFVANPSEFVLHRDWKEVFYSSRSSGPTATLTESPEQSVLTISDRTDHFAFDKRITVRVDGSFRVEYEYEVIDPAETELQVLFGLDQRWIAGSQYSLLVGGKQREGEFEVPAEGRIDPWSGATEQVFTTDFGTLTISSEGAMNLLCTPDKASLWWSQALARGEKYTQVIEGSVEPGPALGRGLLVSGLSWPQPIRNGDAVFTLRLARTEEGPRRVRVEAQPSVNEAVEVTLSDAPTDVACHAQVTGRGWSEFALLISDADTGKEILRMGPLPVQSSPMLSVLPELSLYTDERQANLVVDVADDVSLDELSVQVGDEGMTDATREVTVRRTSLPVDITGLSDGTHEIVCRLVRAGAVVMEAPATLRKAPPRPGAVKIDNISHTLIADGLPLVPFGYYTYFPLAEGVMDEEVVRGFTLFSPYHGGPHDDEQLAQIRAYLDRCAQIGMRVNYHLMWSNRGEMTEERWGLLRAEIEAMRDHPALLSWYIADEPAVGLIQHLERVYDLIKELDPYHPVAVVFCRGADHARKFAGTMDIVMADPYPIPHGPVTNVSDIADAMNEAFDRAKPLWIVPQCFGGNEGWRREPTAAEQRIMTYLSLIHGARAIQYFIRSPRMSFPKSPIMWAECGTLALETAELTPALASHEPAPRVTSSLSSVHACALRDRGIVTVLAANTQNRPQTARLELMGFDFSGEAEVMFEDRRVEVSGGVIEEPIDAFGTRAYGIPVGPMPDEDLAVDPANFTVNPSWEQNPSVGTSAGCYANVPAGATIFVDPRVARHGRHSLRMIAPSDDAMPSIRPFPVKLQEGREYRVSIWARARVEGVAVKLSVGKLGGTRCELGTQWREYSFTVKPDAYINRAGATIVLDGAGVVWLDMFQIVPVE